MRIVRTLGFVTAGALAVAVPAINLVKRDTFKAVSYVRSIDGDTIVVNLPTLPPVFGEMLPIRIAHIDTPELRSGEPCAAKIAQDALEETHHVMSRAKKLELIDPERDSFFRIIADIRINDEFLLSERLLKRGLAVPYEGGTKPNIDWCLL